MLLIALALLAVVWVAVAVAVVGLCRLASAGDRALAAMRTVAIERDFARLLTSV